MGRAWRPHLKEEEDAEEEEKRVRSNFTFSSHKERLDVKVAAMVERVVKRQADLGVDIVTDGEVSERAENVTSKWVLSVVIDREENTCEGSCKAFLFQGWLRGLLHALPEEYLRKIFEYLYLNIYI